MRVPLGLVEMVADEVCLVICHQGLPVTNRPGVIDLGLEGKGILVGVVLGEEFVRRGVEEILKSQLNVSFSLYSNGSLILVGTSNQDGLVFTHISK